jgi:hypothetical protein
VASRNYNSRRSVSPEEEAQLLFKTTLDEFRAWRLPFTGQLAVPRPFRSLAETRVLRSWTHGSVADFHASLCHEGTRTSPSALGRARIRAFSELTVAHRASRQGFLPSQNRTSIHCLRLMGRHRKLGSCSLPVPKQLGESRKWSPSLSRQRRDLAACAPRIL